MGKRKLLVAMATSTVLLGGCAHIEEHGHIEQKKVETLEVIDKVSASFKEAKNKNNSRFIEYKILSEQGDLEGVEQKDQPIDVEVSNAPIGIALDVLGEKLNMSIVYNIEDGTSLNKKVYINAKNSTVEKFISMIERIGNFDIYQSGGALVVSDVMSLQGTFSKLELEDKIYEKMKGYLLDTLVSKNVSSVSSIGNSEAASSVENQESDAQESVHNDTIETQYAPEVIIDELTGAFYIKARPEKIRQSARFIEDIINTSVSHANVELSIFRIDNARAKEVGVSVNRIIDNLYALSAGTAFGQSEKVLSFNREVTEDNGDVLSAGLSLYEKNGLLNTESKTMLTVFNGVATSLSDTQKIGYWTPGGLTENNTIVDGASVVTYTEEKPEFTEEEVGKSLLFTPRIDLSQRVINMKVDYSDSSVYKDSTFSWKRNTNQGDVVDIEKPLKTENKISTVLLLNEGKHTVLAGMKSRKGGVNRKILPGTGGVPLLRNVGESTSEAEETDTLIVVKPIFPEEKVEELITKVKIKL